MSTEPPLTLFISDLHLSPARPAIHSLFLAFLEKRARHAAALYILGDLFEYWVGNGAQNEADSRGIIAALRRLSAAGVAVFIMGGNRDFLLDARFAALCGARHLPDPSVIRLGDQPVLLTHGDLLCTDDTAYQRYRRVIQHPWVLGALSRLPYTWRRRLAGNLRQASRSAMKSKPAMLMDVNARTVEAALRGGGRFPRPESARPYPVLIHGHTHRPDVHTHVVEGHACRRIVLGDWYEQGSYLSCRGSDCRLERFTADTRTAL